jgi:hypothetical protein
MATHRVPGVRNSAMLVVSLDPDRGWWRAAPRRQTPVAATTRGVAPLAGACSQGVPLLSAELEVLNGTPQSLRRVSLDVQLPKAPRKLRGFVQRPESSKSCAASGGCRRREPVWGGAPRGRLFQSSSAGQRWRAGAEWESIVGYLSMSATRKPEP